MMFKELQSLMEHVPMGGDYAEAAGANVLGKRSQSNLRDTWGRLRHLYTFDPSHTPFALLERYWHAAKPSDWPVLALLYALQSDALLQLSAETVLSREEGEPVPVAAFEEALEEAFPGRFTPKTRLSSAQNLASSWKQAGWIAGLRKPVRVKPVLSRVSVAFACHLAYLHGQTGLFILASPLVRVLALPDPELRALLVEASQYDLLAFRHAGDFVSFTFPDLHPAEAHAE